MGRDNAHLLDVRRVIDHLDNDEADRAGAGAHGDPCPAGGRAGLEQRGRSGLVIGNGVEADLPEALGRSGLHLAQDRGISPTAGRILTSINQGSRDERPRAPHLTSAQDIPLDGLLGRRADPEEVKEPADEPESDQRAYAEDLGIAANLDVGTEEFRAVYRHALKQADNGEIAHLLAFARA